MLFVLPNFPGATFIPGSRVVDAKIRASDKDLPVPILVVFLQLFGLPDNGLVKSTNYLFTCTCSSTYGNTGCGVFKGGIQN